MKPFERISNPREIRRRLRLNQQEFWSRIGVTQSGGSRYESGRGMPSRFASCSGWFTSKALSSTGSRAAICTS